MIIPCLSCSKHLLFCYFSSTLLESALDFASISTHQQTVLISPNFSSIHNWVITYICYIVLFSSQFVIKIQKIALSHCFPTRSGYNYCQWSTQHVSLTKKALIPSDVPSRHHFTTSPPFQHPSQRLLLFSVAALITVKPKEKNAVMFLD